MNISQFHDCVSIWAPPSHSISSFCSMLWVSRASLSILAANPQLDSVARWQRQVMSGKWKCFHENSCKMQIKNITVSFCGFLKIITKPKADDERKSERVDSLQDFIIFFSLQLSTQVPSPYPAWLLRNPVLSLDLSFSRILFPGLINWCNRAASPLALSHRGKSRLILNKNYYRHFIWIY